MHWGPMPTVQAMLIIGPSVVSHSGMYFVIINCCKFVITVEINEPMIYMNLMAGVFISLIGSYSTNYSKTVTHQAEIFQGKLSTIVIFIGLPCKLCVNL